jgi:hypothetical protein
MSEEYADESLVNQFQREHRPKGFLRMRIQGGRVEYAGVSRTSKWVDGGSVAEVAAPWRAYLTQHGGTPEPPIFEGLNLKLRYYFELGEAHGSLMIVDLPAITKGSEKQIRWAYDIRERLAHAALKHLWACFSYTEQPATLKKDDVGGIFHPYRPIERGFAGHPEILAVANATAKLFEVDSAKDWIDFRDCYIPNLIKKFTPLPRQQ